jgi:DNA-binding MarR family transcriptional regulator
MTHHPDKYLIDLLLRRFGYLETALMDKLQEEGEFELTRQQVMFFSYLSESCSRASDLAREMKISRQAVHQMVVELENRGFIERERDPVRGNAKIIVKTKKGKALNKAARDQLEKTERMICERIGKQNMNILRDILLQDWGEPLS